MRPKHLLRTVRYVGGLRLEFTYQDGHTQRTDFAPWFNAAQRTPYEKLYRNIEWFKRFRLLDDHAIMWGDHLIVFSAEKLRAGTSLAHRTRNAQAA